ncbi:MAG TPA: putative baseplate assembly protein [Terriglobales bacterium]|jgi:uncharacterized phage protein gp47/JayE|nr:putative baseplate assembly protein [Terriglobales bacterium]
MACAGTTNCDCGCCAGTNLQTPQQENNLPGLSSVSYRAGTWATFKESMLARLSSFDYPALSALRTRSDDDFTIAFLDATAIMLDILTFYQERLANESYLRTATQLRSLTELSRLIGYRPAPGVSASVYLAFTLKTAPGQTPDPSTPAITIPAGSQVQSVPAQGQTPQTFETSADIPAKPDWNALPVQSDQPWVPTESNGIYLVGTATQLQLGDALLFLGVDREEWTSNGNNSPSEQWDVVVINKLQVDNIRKLTYVSWDEPLSHISGNTSSGWTAAAKVFAFRQKAALFGHNAPDPDLFVNLNPPPAAGSKDLIRPRIERTGIDTAIDTTDTSVGFIGLSGSSSVTSLPNLIDTSTSPWQWNNFQIKAYDEIYLDSIYPKIVVGSWFALISSGSAQLYNVQSVAHRSMSGFAISARVTQLSADYEDQSINPGPTPGSETATQPFLLQSTEVWGQSDQLAVAPQPLTYPLYGTALDLEMLRPDLVGIQAVAVSGSSQKIAVADRVTILSFVPDDQTMAPVNLNPGDVLTVTGPAPLPLNSDGSVPDWSSSSVSILLNAQDAAGRTGTVQASLAQFTLAPAAGTDPEVQEYALVNSVTSVGDPFPHTRIQLQSNLLNCYNRSVTTVNANVALATHGQSVGEIMGSGNASTPDQVFTLKQAPLTFVQAPTPTGSKSSLQVQVNGVQWSEAPSLYNQGPSQPVFATLNQSDGTTDVLFGDGVEGSTLPTGQNNIQAHYRIGSGSSGNVAAGAITTLMDRPLGVSGVINPGAATGGQDPQSVDDIRSNAPQTVLTLGRAVSIADYQNYTTTFAGIAKAYALWIPSGPGRGVFLTVAGVEGAALPPGNPTLTNLAASLRNYGNPLIPITVQSYVETLFSFSASVKYDPGYDQPTVQAEVVEALSGTFCFEAMSFGQGVGVDEVTAIIQAVPGVVAVNVTGLRRGLSSTAGDLAGFPTVSGLNKWMSGQIVLNRLFPDSPSQLWAYLPVANTTSVPQPAEILVLDPSQMVLGVMS